MAGKTHSAEGRVIVVGAGKAAARMAQVVEEILGAHLSDGLVVTKYDHGLPLRRIRLVEAGHPIPDANGVLLFEQMRKLLEGSLRTISF